jgi:hypothetical protein
LLLLVSSKTYSTIALAALSTPCTLPSRFVFVSFLLLGVLLLTPSVEVVVLSGAANTFKDNPKDTLKVSMLVVKWGVDLDKGSGSGNCDDDGLEYDEGTVNGVFLSWP